MEMEQEGYHYLFGDIGFLIFKMPQEVINEVKITVDEIQNNFTKAVPHNQYLAGHIDKEYQAKLTPKATQYVRWAVDCYANESPNYLLFVSQLSNSVPKLRYDGDCWINFQEKYEYNPVHNHSGIFSYVMWYQIPYFIEDEVKYGAGKGRSPEQNLNGNFAFMYPIGNNISTNAIRVDNTMEGYMAMFPSSLNHTVYPFYTSDDYRITISGNVFLR